MNPRRPVAFRQSCLDRECPQQQITWENLAHKNRGAQWSHRSTWSIWLCPRAGNKGLRKTPELRTHAHICVHNRVLPGAGLALEWPWPLWLGQWVTAQVLLWEGHTCSLGQLTWGPDGARPPRGLRAPVTASLGGKGSDLA